MTKSGDYDMPTTYVHHRFGRKVLDLLPADIRGDLDPYMDYYDIGVHGPDILFYYHAFHHNAFNQYGVRVHHERAGVFFRKAIKVFKSQLGQPEARAYLAGFMTHFILDSSCHPYINRRAKETGVSHTEIETDLDMVLMKEDGLNPFRVHKTQWIRPSIRKGQVIGPYYDQSAFRIYRGLVWQKFIVDHVFRSRFGLKRSVASVISRTAGAGSGEGSVMKVLKEHFTKSEINPRSRETILTIKGLMIGCQEECADMMTDLMDALNRGDTAFAKHPRLQRNFS